MPAVHKCCRKRCAIEINRRSGNKSRPAYAESEPGSPRRNRRRHKRLIQEWHRIPRCASRIDLNTQKAVVYCHAGRIRHCGFEVPRSAAGRRPADHPAIGSEFQPVRYRSAHHVSGGNRPVVHTPLKRRRAAGERDGLAIGRTHRSVGQRLKWNLQVRIHCNLQRSALRLVCGGGGRDCCLLRAGENGRRRGIGNKWPCRTAERARAGQIPRDPFRSCVIRHSCHDRDRLPLINCLRRGRR